MFYLLFLQIMFILLLFSRCILIDIHTQHTSSFISIQQVDSSIAHQYSRRQNKPYFFSGVILNIRQMIHLFRFFFLIHLFYSLSGISTLYTLLWLLSLYQKQWIGYNNIRHNNSDDDQQVEYDRVYKDDDINIIGICKVGIVWE